VRERERERERRERDRDREREERERESTETEISAGSEFGGAVLVAATVVHISRVPSFSNKLLLVVHSHLELALRDASI